MKRLFIIGASVLQVPAIVKAKEMGLYTAVADFNPDAVGVPLADEYYNVSTIDPEGVLKAAEQFQPDGIMTLATDMPMRSVAYAAARLGLPGVSFDTAVKATDKGEMIKAFAAAGVEHPWFFILDGTADADDIAEKITYPCISKPTDSSGSRGVMIVNNKEELAAAVGYSAASGRIGTVIVEEYMRGSEVSVEVMVIGGSPRVLAVTDKLTTGAPHFVEMGHSQPSALGAKEIAGIEDLACRAVKAVGIDNGPAHVEIMLTPGGPKMIELGARLGGDCITTHLVPLSTGVDMVGASIQLALGEIPDSEVRFHKGAAIRYADAPKGVIRSIEGVSLAKEIPGVREVTFTKGPGDTVGEIKGSLDRAGYVIAQAETPGEAVEVCVNALKKIRITVGVG